MVPPIERQERQMEHHNQTGRAGNGPKRKLRHTFSTRVSPKEDALIRAAAEEAGEREGRRVTPSALIRRIVVAELTRELRRGAER